MSLCIYLNPGYGTIVIETKDKIRSWISGLIFLLCMANPFAFVFATTYIDTTDNGTQNPANPNVNITNIFASQAAFFGLSSGSSSVTATSLRFVLTSQSLSATQADVTLNVYALDQNGEPAGNSLFSQTFQNVNVSGYVASGNQPDVVLRPSNLVISPGTNYAFAISSSVNLFAWSYSPPGSAPPLATSGGFGYVSSGYRIGSGAARNETNLYTLGFQLNEIFYSLGGAVSGLESGQSVILQNNGSDDLTINADGAFSFSSPVPEGGTYAVTVLSQPSGKFCTVGNGSGTVNSNVSNVSVSCLTQTEATVITPGGNVNAHIVGGGFVPGTAQFTTPINPPSGQSFPYGVFGFIASTNVGGSITVTLTYPQALAAGIRVWKELHGTWSDWTNRVIISGNTITYTIADGGDGDSDGMVDGSISDPLGPANPVTSVPSLSESAQLMLAVMLLMLFGWHFHHKRSV